MNYFLVGKTIFILLIALCLSCCSKKSDQTKEIKELKDQLALIETKAILLELKLKEIDERSQGNWVLWQTTEWFESSKFVNNFGWPKMLSAHPTKVSCTNNAKQYSFPQNNRVVLDADP